MVIELRYCALTAYIDTESKKPEKKLRNLPSFSIFYFSKIVTESTDLVWSSDSYARWRSKGSLPKLQFLAVAQSSLICARRFVSSVDFTQGTASLFFKLSHHFFTLVSGFSSYITGVSQPSLMVSEGQVPNLEP